MIFEKINKETGWRIGFVYKELKEKWGWNEDPSPQQFAQTHTAARQAQEVQDEQQRQMQDQGQRASLSLQQGFAFGQLSAMQPQQVTPTLSTQMSPPQQTPQQQQQSLRASAPQGKSRMPSGIPNPLYAKADFNLPQHPYQNFYVAPNTAHNMGFGNGHQNGGNNGGNNGGPLYYAS